MKCINCFEEVDDNAKFCPLCGFDIGAYNPASYHLSPQTVIGGRFIIGKVIGEGGFGITYKACDTVLGAKYAVKEYYPAEISGRGNKSEDGNTIFPFTGEEEAFSDGLERFENEARRMTEFDGLAGIVNVKDYFSENGTGYIVMEYVEGTSLESYLKSKGGRIPLSEAMKLVKPVILSLGRVHSKGIIHRDISPDNIMLTEKNGAVLIDFGSARQFDSEKSLSVIIKYGYAPYEQYGRHGKQGPWTDVYAMSGVIYRMVTGERPPDAIARIQGEAELLEMKKFDPSVTSSQEKAIKMGLESKAANRLKSMKQLYEALYKGNFDFPEEAIPGSEDPVQKKKLHPASAAAIAAAAVIAISAGTFLAVRYFGGSNDIIASSVSESTSHVSESTSPVSESALSVSESTAAETMPEYISVPTLTGLTEEEAVKLLNSMDIPFNVLSKEDKSTAKGTVLSQEPPAGEDMEKGGTVSFSVNSLDTVLIPAVTDTDADEAEKMLTDLGLTVKITPMEKYEYEHNKIITQSLSEGSYALKGDEITLSVNKLPQPLVSSAPKAENCSSYTPEIFFGVPPICDLDTILAGRSENMYNYAEKEITVTLDEYGSGWSLLSAEDVEREYGIDYGTPGELTNYAYIQDDFDYDGRDEYYFAISEVINMPINNFNQFDVSAVMCISIYYIDNNGDYSFAYGHLESAYFNTDGGYDNYEQFYSYVTERMNQGFTIGAMSDCYVSPVIMDYGDCKHLFLPRSGFYTWGGDVLWGSRHIKLQGPDGEVIAEMGPYVQNEFSKRVMGVVCFKHESYYADETHPDGYYTSEEVENFILNNYTDPEGTNYSPKVEKDIRLMSKCYIWNGKNYILNNVSENIRNQTIE